MNTVRITYAEPVLPPATDEDMAKARRSAEKAVLERAGVAISLGEPEWTTDKGWPSLVWTYEVPA